MSWLDKYQVVRRATLGWSMWLITETIEAYTGMMGKVQLADVTVITGVIGILAVVIGFQAKEECKHDRSA